VRARALLNGNQAFEVTWLSTYTKACIRQKIAARAGRLFLESSSRSSFLFEHDLFRKPLHTFRDHALAVDSYSLDETRKSRIRSATRCCVGC
jgi:hypothetical protein